MINAGTRHASEITRTLSQLHVDLTVTVGRDERLRRAIESAAGDRKVNVSASAKAISG